MVRVFIRNLLVLALHAFVCIAGFMAMRALPEQTKYKSGVNRWVHEHAGPVDDDLRQRRDAVLDHDADLDPRSRRRRPRPTRCRSRDATLMLTVLPHAADRADGGVPAAGGVPDRQSRGGDWHELLAATVVTVSVALPMIIFAAFMEAYLWPVTLQNVLF